jgi:hypothetical protein
VPRNIRSSKKHISLGAMGESRGCLECTRGNQDRHRSCGVSALTGHVTGRLGLQQTVLYQLMKPEKASSRRTTKAQN